MSEQLILVVRKADEPELRLLKELAPGFRAVVGSSAAEFGDALQSATAMLSWFGARQSLRDVFLQSPKLQWMHASSAGLDTVLFPELVESPVILTNGTGVFSASLGEFAIAAILYFAKDLRRMIRNQRAEIWEPFDVEPVAGKTVGIVGYGDIGRAVAGRAHALGMRVLALKRRPQLRQDDATIVDEVFAGEGMTEMLSRSDYVVVAAPLTEETRGMMGEAELASMKRSAVLINIGRGPVIAEGALIHALERQAIRGAALDVFDHEPLAAGHPFYGMENVLLSPHCADHLPGWKESAMRFFLEQAQRFSSGEPLKNIVDKQRGY